jgi:hypothetical protein
MMNVNHRMRHGRMQLPGTFCAAFEHFCNTVLLRNDVKCLISEACFVHVVNVRQVLSLSGYARFNEHIQTEN